MKGSQLLEACTACFGWKVSCWTAGRGSRKKASVKDHSARKPEESIESDEAGDESRWEWLTRFSNLKEGPAKHAKPTAETKHLSLGAKVTAHRMTKQASRT